MDKDELTRRLMGVFLDEMEEHVAAWNRDLLALERTESRDERDALVRSLFRTAHSLKGAARSVGLGPLEQLCHRLESRLATVRDGSEPMDDALVERLLAAGDVIADAREQLRRGRPLEHVGGLDLSSVRQTPSAASEPPARDQAAVGAAPLRVAAEKLDALLLHTGELRAASTKLDARSEDVHSLRDRVRRMRRTADAATAETMRQIEHDLDRLAMRLRAEARTVVHATREVEAGVRATRMMPFHHACEGLDRIVRDAARASGKEAALAIDGGAVEVDRAVVEALRDPLVHLVRNAVVHGIEHAADRRAAGKRERGRVTISASLRGSEVAISVGDDGAGLDLDAIARRAGDRGVAVPREKDEIARLVFVAGLSTARNVDELSGRGVGLDVVKARVEAIHGGIDIATAPGEGTLVTVAVPLTLSTVQSLVLRVGPHAFALPTTHVRTMCRVDPGRVMTVDRRSTLVMDGTAVPFGTLHEALGLPPPPAPEPGALLQVIVAVAAAGVVALRVDELVDVQSVVVEGLGPRILDARNVAGVTVLSSGELALILSGGDLVRSALAARAAGASGTAAVAPRRRAERRLLVADDSATTRALERTILEAAGYRVVVAPDGEAAWRLLQEQGADLVVSDVEMPGLDGFELTRRIRESARFRELPIVLLTALARDEDRLAGLEAGANAYLVKSAFDQSELLRVIEELL